MGAVPETAPEMEIMKTIELKSVPLVAFGEEQTLEYKSLLQVIVETPEDRQSGASIEEQRKSIRILDRLETSNGKMELEDADFEYLLKRVQKTRFTSNNRAFVEFVDYLEKVSKDGEKTA